MKKRIIQTICVFAFLVFMLIYAYEGELYSYKNEELNSNLMNIDIVDDMDILIDNDYFKYELLDETNTDMDLVTSHVAPIQMGVDDVESYFSAFIYKIEEDYIYGLSGEHCIDRTHDVLIQFFNDEQVTVEIEYVNFNGESDISLFRFKTDYLNKELLMQLKQAYIDANCYDSLAAGEPLVAYAENHNPLGNTTREVKKVNFVSANENAYFYDDICLSTTRGLFGGMSGCPVLDNQGHVLGIASTAYWGKGIDLYTKLTRVEELETKLIEKYGGSY